MPRKRAREETELDPSFLEADAVVHDHGALQQVRNMWEFASLMQYIHFFGHVVKIDDNLEVEDLENACVLPDKAFKLAEIGLAMLKYVSSHRGLTPELFDDYTRRQFLARAPQRNPFGDHEEPLAFADFNVHSKLRVLHQLSIWTLGNAERIRGLTAENDAEQALWRIEPFGWDSEDNTYYVLDDNRLYRRTEPVESAPPPKSKSRSKAKAKVKPRSKGHRASKRRKLSDAGSDVDASEHIDVDVDDTVDVSSLDDAQQKDDHLFGTWSCVAVTLEEYQAFIESIRKSRDPNEKLLCRTIIDTVLPQLEKKAEDQRQKALKRQREFEALQRMATAKRSSRIAGKIDRQKEEEEAAAAEKKHREELQAAHREAEREKQMLEARESRMQTREQRLKEREYKRILHEEELARIEAAQLKGEDADSRRSDRQLATEMERRQQELERIRAEEEDWMFDCAVCGVYGQNLDDGSPMFACEKCNTWQHLACYGLSPVDAEREDFHFVCSDCQRKAETDSRPKLAPLKLKRPSQSPRTSTDRDGVEDAIGPSRNGHGQSSVPGTTERASTPPTRVFSQTPGGPASPAKRLSDLQDGPSLSPQGQSTGPPGYRPNGGGSVGVPQPVWEGTSLPPPPRLSLSPRPAAATDADETIAKQMGDIVPPRQLHRLAHESAVSNAELPHELSGHGDDTDALPDALPAIESGYSNRAVLSSPQRPPIDRPAHTPNAVVSSPVKSRYADRPDSSYGRRSSHGLLPLAGSPGPVFLPSDQEYHSQAAGHSPVKQPSSSPQPPPSRHGRPYSPGAGLMAMTPTTFGRQTSPTPSNGVLRGAASHMASSPIPPLSEGQVIPLKQDTPRQLSRDGIADTAVVPPSLALSPTATEGGKGMSTESATGGLGTGTVPIKKQPEGEVAHAEDVSMQDV